MIAYFRWLVSVSAIEWDDDDGAYDVSELPREATVSVVALDRQGAIERALDDLSEDYSFLIAGCDTTVKRLGPA